MIQGARHLNISAVQILSQNLLPLPPESYLCALEPVRNFLHSQTRVLMCLIGVFFFFFECWDAPFPPFLCLEEAVF